jgi:hypothetical protein
MYSPVVRLNITLSFLKEGQQQHIYGVNDSIVLNQQRRLGVRSLEAVLCCDQEDSILACYSNLSLKLQSLDN